MFRRHKKENKTKLEHKLYLARENPEPIFDLAECGIHNVPSGVYSLCRVFLKERLHLEHNYLSSLAGGGNLKELHLLKVLDIHDNAFSAIPNEIEFVVNLIELYINDNHIKKLPPGICKLKKLRVLDASNNLFKNLPEDIGNLANLRKLNINGNTGLKNLPKGICYAQRLREIQLDPNYLVYPPTDVAQKGTEAIMRRICDDINFTYVPPDELEDPEDELESTDIVDAYDISIKEQKALEFLEMERYNELMQQQEFDLATALKANREKLLTDIAQQQLKFDAELTKVQQMKDGERFRLVEQLQEVEQNADRAIAQLLAFNKDPLLQLTEQERREEERLLSAASKCNETLRKAEVLQAMQELLEQETERFKLYDEGRSETKRSILEQEMNSDSHLADVLHRKDSEKAELVAQLQEDVELQKVVVGALLERTDARSWGLVQQVRLVELQLAALTTIELDRRKLELDEHVNDLAEKRSYLSALLVELLYQQEQRRAQLLITLQSMEENNNMEDFWLRQYQQLLARMPQTITEAQKDMDPALVETLLMTGVLHCIPFLAHLLYFKGDVLSITEDDILSAGVTNVDDREKIVEAFRIYLKQAPRSPEGASAPPLEEAPAGESLSQENECVVCMEIQCEVIFVPCGHLCCCVNCSSPLADCPMCRAEIERKIRIYMS